MCRNLVKFKKKADDVISNLKVITVVLMLLQLKKWEIFIVSLFLVD